MDFFQYRLRVNFRNEQREVLGWCLCLRGLTTWLIGLAAWSLWAWEKYKLCWAAASASET
jgi:hypothetical protein